LLVSLAPTTPPLTLRKNLSASSAQLATTANWRVRLSQLASTPLTTLLMPLPLMVVNRVISAESRLFLKCLTLLIHSLSPPLTMVLLLPETTPVGVLVLEATTAPKLLGTLTLALWELTWMIRNLPRSATASLVILDTTVELSVSRCLLELLSANVVTSASLLARKLQLLSVKNVL